MGIFYEEVKERMIRYARINTQSARFTGTWPTTERQFDLARLLEAELREIGASDVYLDPVHCVVYGKIPATVEVSSTSPVGFIAHMDTAPDQGTQRAHRYRQRNHDQRGGHRIRFYADAAAT
jgi:tripeptide aminopeptidase